MDSRWFLRSSLLALSLALLAPDLPASACKGPVSGLSLPASEVPAGGALWLAYTCVEAPCVAERLGLGLRLEDVSGAAPMPLAVTVVARGVLPDGQSGWAWVEPAQPFVAGRRYEVSEQDKPARYSFEAVAAQPFDPKTLMLGAQLVRRQKETGERVCCEPKESFNGSCGERPCFSPTRQEQLVLQLAPTATAEPLPGATQWLYTTTFSAGERAVKFGPLPMLPSEHAFELPAASYCVKVETQRRELSAPTTLFEQCFPTPVSALAVRPASDEELALALTSCKAAPVGYERPFRVAQGELLVEESFPEPEPTPVVPVTELNPEPVGPSEPVLAPTPAPELPGTEPQPEPLSEPAGEPQTIIPGGEGPREEAGGCSARGAAVRPSHSWLTLLALASFALGMRRRRRA